MSEWNAWVPYARNSRRFPVIVVEQTAETGPGFDRSFDNAELGCRLQAVGFRL